MRNDRPTYWPYIASVAIAPGSGGYAIELPWQGPSCNNNDGGNDGGNLPSVTLAVSQFGTPGTPIAGASVGSAGASNGSPIPRVAVDPADGSLAWAFGITNNTGGNPDIAAVFATDPTVQIPLQISFPGGPAPNAAGMVLSAGTAWVAVSTSMTETSNPDSPQFPSCCSDSNTGSSTGALYRVDGSGSPAQLASVAVASTVADPLVASSSDLSTSRPRASRSAAWSPTSTHSR